MPISSVKTNATLKARKVTIIGYDKSATDIAGAAAEVANETHLTFRDTHWPVPRPTFIPFMRKGRIQAHGTEIARYTKGGLDLPNGDRIAANCVVFGAGWTSDFDYLASKIIEALGPEEDGFYLYCHMLHPGVPNLAFMGRASTFLSVLTDSLQARLLAELLAGRVTLPDRGDAGGYRPDEALEAELDAVQSSPECAYRAAHDA